MAKTLEEFKTDYLSIMVQLYPTLTAAQIHSCFHKTTLRIFAAPGSDPLLTKLVQVRVLQKYLLAWYHFQNDLDREMSWAPTFQKYYDQLNHLQGIEPVVPAPASAPID